MSNYKSQVDKDSTVNGNTNSRNMRKGSNYKGRNNRNRKSNPNVESTTKYGDNSNDPSWYAKNPQLLKDAASLAFSNRTGDHFDLGIEPTYDWSTANPGICTLNWVPSLGRVRGSFDANAATDPVNLAALNVYSYVRHANSGSANYDAPDLMAAILAADSIFSVIAHLIRAYGIARVYDQKNRYTPKAMLTALGFNADNIINNLANFRYMINNLIAKASVIWVPSNMSVVTRHFWMNSNIYKDSDSPKAQFYAFKPSSAWKFEPKASTTGSSLSVVSLNWSGMTVEQIGYMVSDLIEPIISDEDMGIMFGDMLKAYGKENLYSINMISEDYVVLPTFNKEVLMQIHNCITLDVPLYPVVQSSNGVLYEKSEPLTFSVEQLGKHFGPKRYIFDYMDMIPEPENIMVASRLMQRWSMSGSNENLSPSTATQYSFNIDCGTERILSYRINYFGVDGNLNNVIVNSFYNSTEQVEEFMIEMLERFDWAPLLYLVSGSSYETSPVNHVNRKLDVVVGDLDNYTVVDFSVLQKMDATAVFSEFDVPLSL